MQVMRCLLRAGADVNGVGEFTPLAAAAKAGKLDAMRVLIAAGADLERPADGGYTALCFAAIHGQVCMPCMGRGEGGGGGA